MGRGADGLQGHGEAVRMKRQDNTELTKAELEGLHSVLRRAAERAEAEKRMGEAAKLAEELAVVEYEMRRG